METRRTPEDIFRDQILREVNQIPNDATETGLADILENPEETSLSPMAASILETPHLQLGEINTSQKRSKKRANKDTSPKVTSKLDEEMLFEPDYHKDKVFLKSGWSASTEQSIPKEGMSVNNSEGEFFIIAHVPNIEPKSHAFEHFYKIIPKDKLAESLKLDTSTLEPEIVKNINYTFLTVNNGKLERFGSTAPPQEVAPEEFDQEDKLAA